MTRLKNGPETLTDTSPKKIYRWQISTWKDAPHEMSSGKWEINQRGTTIYLSEWSKSRTPTQPNVDENVEQQRPSHLLLLGRQVILEDWRFLTKLNILLRYGPAVTVFGIYPKEYRKPISTPKHRWLWQVFS